MKLISFIKLFNYLLSLLSVDLLSFASLISTFFSAVDFLTLLSDFLFCFTELFEVAGFDTLSDFGELVSDLLSDLLLTSVGTLFSRSAGLFSTLFDSGRSMFSDLSTDGLLTVLTGFPEERCSGFEVGGVSVIEVPLLLFSTVLVLRLLVP